jgi:hypothetical protein
MSSEFNHDLSEPKVMIKVIDSGQLLAGGDPQMQGMFRPSSQKTGEHCSASASPFAALNARMTAGQFDPIGWNICG